MSVAIVVVAYNRPRSLARLLNSLRNSTYEDRDVELVISIDYQDSANHDAVVKLASEFDWEYGEKTLIVHPTNLGLRSHVLFCGDLSEKYGAIIMLEDDLVVSPYFYKYATECLLFYADDTRIAGISMYNHTTNFSCNLPFQLVGECHDVYFLQIASSWGQAWSQRQWRSFRDWYAGNQVLDDSDDIPTPIVNWPETSWLKYFIKFMVQRNLYFVYPKVSYSTNFSDNGTHNAATNPSYQVVLNFSNKSDIDLVRLEESINVYDSFFELSEAVLKKLAKLTVEQRLVVDFYGLKDLAKYEDSYAISSKSLIKGSKGTSYGLDLKPMVMNVIYNNQGSCFHLSKCSNFDSKSRELKAELKFFTYFFGNVSALGLLKILLDKLRTKVTSKLKRS